MKRTRQKIPLLSRGSIEPQHGLPGPDILSPQLASLGWPVELQGSAIPQDGGSYRLLFPIGDVFFSFFTCLHEIGHLRQRDIAANLSRRRRPLPDGTSILVTEEEAYCRGWARLGRHTPDKLVYLNELYDRHWHEDPGKFRGYARLEDLYDWFIALGMRISRVRDAVPDCASRDEYGSATAEALRAAGVDQLFVQMKSLYVGE